MSQSSGSSIIELHHAAKIHRATGREAAGVFDVTISINAGELVLLLGPSGSGKTTLLTLIAGLVAPTSGSVVIDGERLDRLSLRELQRFRANRIGFVFQSFNLIDALTAVENVALVLRFAGLTGAEASRRAFRLLADSGIGHLAAEYPPHLSQGEKQRVAVVRGIANEPVLLLADEPTASLDSDSGLRIIQLLHSYARERHCAVVVATHDLRLTAYADRVVHLHDGHFTSAAVSETVTVP